MELKSLTLWLLGSLGSNFEIFANLRTVEIKWDDNIIIKIIIFCSSSNSTGETPTKVSFKYHYCLGEILKILKRSHLWFSLPMGKCVSSLHCFLDCFPLNASSSGHIHHSCHLFPVFFPNGPALYLHLGVAANQNIVLQRDLGADVNGWPKKVRPEPVSQQRDQKHQVAYWTMAWEVVLFQWQEIAIDLCIQMGNGWRETSQIFSIVWHFLPTTSVMREFKSTRTRPAELNHSLPHIYDKTNYWSLSL